MAVIATLHRLSSIPVISLLSPSPLHALGFCKLLSEGIGSHTEITTLLPSSPSSPSSSAAAASQPDAYERRILQSKSSTHIFEIISPTNNKDQNGYDELPTWNLLGLSKIKANAITSTSDSVSNTSNLGVWHLINQTGIDSNKSGGVTATVSDMVSKVFNRKRGASERGRNVFVGDGGGFGGEGMVYDLDDDDVDDHSVKAGKPSRMFENGSDGDFILRELVVPFNSSHSSDSPSPSQSFSSLPLTPTTPNTFISINSIHDNLYNSPKLLQPVTGLYQYPSRKHGVSVRPIPYGRADFKKSGISLVFKVKDLVSLRAKLTNLTTADERFKYTVIGRRATSLTPGSTGQLILTHPYYLPVNGLFDFRVCEDIEMRSHFHQGEGSVLGGSLDELQNPSVLNSGVEDEDEEGENFVKVDKGRFNKVGENNDCWMEARAGAVDVIKRGVK